MTAYIKFLVVVALFMSVSCEHLGGTPDNRKSILANPAVIGEWNELSMSSSAPLSHVLLATRANAIMHLAIHDALNAIDPRYEKYLYTKSNAKANAGAAVASAAYHVLKACFPDSEPAYLELYNQQLASIKNDERKTAGIALGKEVAETILAARANDNAFGDPISTPAVSNAPGVYQVVSPMNFLYGADWITVKPFGLISQNQFRCVPPPALTSERYTNDFNEVISIGRSTSSTRTAVQTDIVKFWYEFSEIGWNRIARRSLEQQKLGAHETARLYALLNIGLMDAYLAGWDSKFYYNFWRPHTAILHAANDGNPATAGVDNWESVLPTPPVQDYPSTHSALGNAGATILSGILGESITFSTVSTTFENGAYTKTFSSFLTAADENAESRVLGGLHFRFSCEAGQQLGNDIGQWILANQLRPIQNK